MNDKHISGVVRFFDTHPINEDEIVAKLLARGVNLEQLTEDELKDFDQDHYGGIESVDILADRAGIMGAHHVLDVCSGMGGPARWLAHCIGCHVTGLDITKSRVESANRLTQRVKLTNLVDFVHGNATDMPLPDATYDAIISQESWAHIPAKSKLFSECFRVLKPKGIVAFTDAVLREPLTREEQTRLAKELHAPKLVTVNGYLEILSDTEFTIVSNEDLSTEWADVLAERLKMYRSLRDTTVEKFGEEHFKEWDHLYSFYVQLFVSGKLGGARLVARKPPD